MYKRQAGDYTARLAAAVKGGLALRRPEEKTRLDTLQNLEAIADAIRDSDHRESGHAWSPGYGLPTRCLALADPPSAAALLEETLRHHNRLVALEAAVVLALLGRASGEQVMHDVLRNHETMTASGIEFCYAKAGLLLLGVKPTPEEDDGNMCQFREPLGRLIEEGLKG